MEENKKPEVAAETATTASGNTATSTGGSVAASAAAAPRGNRPNNNNRGRGPGKNDNRRDGRNNRRAPREQSEFKEKVVSLNRVAKVVKGGRNFRFVALVVVGDQKGRVGCGTGKAAEIPDAIRKAIESAKKNLVTVSLVGTTIPHEVTGEFGAGKVVVKPAKEGTGVIAGGAARAVLELVGVRDVRTKSLRSKNPRNVVLATINALSQMRNADQVAAVRGITKEQLYKGANA